MIFEGYNDMYDMSARLCILRLLAEQPDYRMTDSMLDDLLVTRWAINRGRAYVRTQLAWLENSAGAVRNIEGAAGFVSQLTQAGADHVLRRHTLPGIKRPGPGH
ncbi:hypothetical protein [Tianweitania sediminis]|uniref:Uncharacterized protein n=1 Tax=Tianweitania sediminis TaxID=1502156 RepID=A0A8J7RP63_9HYPH|nr:hypothetical protein [Tianweitania sediminis]MBP0439449.1 hypothetical protein [Tianweitania sediminis]